MGEHYHRRDLCASGRSDPERRLQAPATINAKCVHEQPLYHFQTTVPDNSHLEYPTIAVGQEPNRLSSQSNRRQQHKVYYRSQAQHGHDRAPSKTGSYNPDTSTVTASRTAHPSCDRRPHQHEGNSTDHVDGIKKQWRSRPDFDKPSNSKSQAQKYVASRNLQNPSANQNSDEPLGGMGSKQKNGKSFLAQVAAKPEDVRDTGRKGKFARLQTFLARMRRSHSSSKKHGHASDRVAGGLEHEVPSQDRAHLLQLRKDLRKGSPASKADISRPSQREDIFLADRFNRVHRKPATDQARQAEGTLLQNSRLSSVDVGIQHRVSVSGSGTRTAQSTRNHDILLDSRSASHGSTARKVVRSGHAISKHGWMLSFSTQRRNSTGSELSFACRGLSNDPLVSSKQSLDTSRRRSLPALPESGEVDDLSGTKRMPGRQRRNDHSNEQRQGVTSPEATPSTNITNTSTKRPLALRVRNDSAKLQGHKSELTATTMSPKLPFLKSVERKNPTIINSEVGAKTFFRESTVTPIIHNEMARAVHPDPPAAPFWVHKFNSPRQMRDLGRETKFYDFYDDLEITRPKYNKADARRGL
ncbi:MAG: hypothetical protein M1828_006741 [Chrysothrix sp. TS-e1954]|nr:MAG: hypothetical protein M1828_006741 [Chrysothrix sp. TS-e1954]